MVGKEIDYKASEGNTPVFEISVEIITAEPTQTEEQAVLETTVPVEEVAQAEVSVEQTPETTPEPIVEVTTTEPEPKPTVEEVIKETISGDIVSTDSSANQDVDEVLNEETAPHIPEGAIPIIVKISHYAPGLGGPNCARFVNGECLSKMSNGERWQDYWDENNTIACPFELAFGTVIWLDGNEYTCRDRGGAIVITYEGYYWIDILAERVPYKYGETREAYILP